MVLVVLIALIVVLAFFPTIRCAVLHPFALAWYGVKDMYYYFRRLRFNLCGTGELENAFRCYSTSTAGTTLAHRGQRVGCLASEPTVGSTFQQRSHFWPWAGSTSTFKTFILLFCSSA